MSYTIEWLVPQQLVLVKFGAVFTATELVEFDKEICAMLDMGAPKQVHHLLDVAELQQFPNLGQAIQTKMLQHPNLGWTVFIGDKNPIIQTMGMLIARLFGNHLQWCNTREEALAFIQNLAIMPPK